MNPKMKGVGAMKYKFICVIALTILFVSLSAVYSYSLLGVKWNTGGIHPYDVPLRYTFELVEADAPEHPYFNIYVGYELAVGDWNAAQNYIRYKKNISASNYLGVFWDVNQSHFGRITLECTGDNIDRFDIYVNTNSSALSDWTIARSVAGHELGHGLGLDHSAQTAIMNSNRNRQQIYSPQSDDIDGANAIYSALGGW